MDNLKDMKDEVLVMTNASDGNKPHGWSASNRTAH